VSSSFLALSSSSVEDLIPDLIEDGSFLLELTDDGDKSAGRTDRLLCTL
jgi:hypothetical protein